MNPRSFSTLPRFLYGVNLDLFSLRFTSVLRVSTSLWNWCFSIFPFHFYSVFLWRCRSFVWWTPVEFGVSFEVAADFPSCSRWCQGSSQVVLLPCLKFGYAGSQNQLKLFTKSFHNHHRLPEATLEFFLVPTPVLRCGCKSPSHRLWSRCFSLSNLSKSNRKAWVQESEFSWTSQAGSISSVVHGTMFLHLALILIPECLIAD